MDPDSLSHFQTRRGDHVYINNIVRKMECQVKQTNKNAMERIKQNAVVCFIYSIIFRGGNDCLFIQSSRKASCKRLLIHWFSKNVGV